MDRSPRKLPLLRSIRWFGALCIGLAPGLLLSAVPAVPAVAAEKPETPITESCSGPIDGAGRRLCGTLNPHSSAKVGSYFAYNVGASCTGGSVVPAGGEVEGQDIEVSGEATGLQAATEYTYCLVATNSAGETFGQPLSFTTPATESPPQSKTQISEPCSLLCAGPAFGPSASVADAGQSHSPASTASKPLTRAQKLARALKKCHKDPKSRRTTCERWAHKTYGVVRKKDAARSARGGKQR
jgi:hypothetical protein